ncbi:MAG: sigma-70 family RNA polymerase sigma factor [Clostridia bacterium]|nr:sigma-70 family RNA polymerase sigma factor [Clostridia bacterium]
MAEVQNEKVGYDKNPELIERYRAGDTEAGEELVRLNTPLVYKIAARFRERAPDMSDVIECGTIGLVKAIKTFDCERGCCFSTYAVPLIFGEIRRFLRDDGIIKVSRVERRLSARLNREREERLNRGEPADLVSVAAAVGVSPSDAASALFADAPVRSLEESIYDGDDTVTLGSTLGDDEEAQARFDRLALHLAIEKLGEVEKRLIILRYFRDLSQSETARALGLSQVKVSREEKKIMAKLKRDLETV